MRKKILSSILGLSMMLTALPTTAFAVDARGARTVTTPPTVTSYGVMLATGVGDGSRLPGGAKEDAWDSNASDYQGKVVYFGIQSGTMPTTGELTFDVSVTTSETSNNVYSGVVKSGNLSSAGSWTSLSFGLLNTSQFETVDGHQGLYNTASAPEALEKTDTIKKVVVKMSYDQDGSGTEYSPQLVNTYTLADLGKKGQLVVVNPGEYTVDIPGTRESVLGVATAHLYDNVKATKNDKGVYELTGTSYYYENFNAFDTDAAGNFVATRVTVPSYLYSVELTPTWTVGDTEYTGSTFTPDAENHEWIQVSCLNDIASATGEAKNRITMTLTWKDENIRNNVVNANVSSSVTYTFDTSKLVLEDDPDSLHKVTVTGLDANKISFYTKDGSKTTPITDLTKVKKGTTVYFKLLTGEETVIDSLKIGETAQDVVAGKEYSFTMGESNVIVAVEARNSEHTVTLNTPAFGKYTVVSGMSFINSGDKVADDATLTITPVANTGYKIASVTVSRGGSTAETITGSDGKYTIENVKTDVKINVTFEEVRNTITVVDPDKGGDVSVSVSSELYGKTVTVETTPDDGYELDNVVVTYVSGKNTVNVPVSISGVYATFTMPNADVTVTATFKKPAVEVKDGAVASVKDDGKSAEATVDKDKVKDTLTNLADSKETNATIELDSTTDSDTVTSITVSLPQGVIDAVNNAIKDSSSLENVNVTVKTDAGNVGVNGDVLEKISEESKNGATLSVSKSDADEVNEKLESGDSAAADNTYAVEVKFLDKDGKSIDVADGDKNIQITLTLNFGSSINSKNYMNYKLMYKGESGKSEEIPWSSVLNVNDNGDVTFVVNHLTTFYLASTKSAAATTKLNVRVDKTAGDMADVASHRITVSNLTADTVVTVQTVAVVDGVEMLQATTMTFGTADGSKYVFYVDGNVNLTIIEGLLTGSEMLTTARIAEATTCEEKA